MTNLDNKAPSSEMKSSNWHVITGAPCSGKTAVIHELARLGFPVVHEVARAYIETQLARGLSLGQIKQDELAFERRLLSKKVALERDLNPRDIIFFDRAVPDSIAYYRLAGLDPAEPIAAGRHTRYKTIFFLERLPVQRDAVRKEDDRTAETIETFLMESYQALGYPLIRIPVSSVSQRRDEILGHIGKKRG